MRLHLRVVTLLRPHKEEPKSPRNKPHRHPHGPDFLLDARPRCVPR